MIKLLRRLITLAWVLTLLVIGCVLYLFNPIPISINFVWTQTPPISLAVVLISTFFIGVVSGSLLTLIVSIWPVSKSVAND
ncbi:lipopolysaccharide assembly protein LapA domain-containing protein [Litorivicinus sp.]|nr:lipopolysaccharide assembly protein LapA domain-containing protein [Litorivicinus sp.]